MDKTPAAAIKTPQRRLGVGLPRRSLGGLLASARTPTLHLAARNAGNSSPNPSPGIINITTPIAATARRQPTVTTTAEKPPLPPPIGSQSTGGRLSGSRRLYGLSLNSRVRDKYSRKRLNFAQQPAVREMVSEIVAEAALESRTSAEYPIGEANDDDDDADCSDLAELRVRCQAQIEQLATGEERHREQERLRAAVVQWEHGFRAAFANLLDLIEAPDTDAAVLFAQLNLPGELLALLEQ